jgi:hypothetical protein
MADTKISALPGASTPLAGTEVLPIVQSGATVKVAVSNITAGRSVSVADLAVSTENIVVGTAAKGVNFTANSAAAGMTSQLLNWYEEGTFTPVLAGDATPGTGTYSVQLGLYTRIGRQVSYSVNLVWSAHTGAGNMVITGLPFTSKNVSNLYYSAAIVANNIALTANNYPACFILNNSTSITLRQLPTGGGATAVIPLDTAGTFIINGEYSI